MNSSCSMSSKSFHKIYTFITLIFVCLLLSTIFTSKDKDILKSSLTTKLLLGFSLGILILNSIFASIYYCCNRIDPEEGFTEPLV